jgi:DNA adenine methylase
MRSIKWESAGRWVEPFLGSGVVVFNVRPERALLADTNEHIINVYRAIQSGNLNPHNLRRFLEKEGEELREKGQSHYYDIRERFNSEHSPFDFLFLNRSCFNGMIRFNSKGKFNVPFCRKPERFSKSYVTKICNQVAWVKKQMRGKKWEFVAQDWRQTLAQVETDDFVYLDPPYNDRHTDYYNSWSSIEADKLAVAVKGLPSGFAYSTWKENKYRVNDHLQKHFADYPLFTKVHFYHVGPKEKLRNAMEEALIIAPGFVAEEIEGSLHPVVEKQLTFSF